MPWGLGGLFLLPVAPSRGRDAPMLQAQGSGWAPFKRRACRNQGSLHAGLQMTRTLRARGAPAPASPVRHPVSVTSGTTLTLCPCGEKCGK